MKTKYHHIRMEADGAQGKFICLNCQTTLAVSFPLRITTFVSVSNAFIKEHKNCKKS